MTTAPLHDDAPPPPPATSHVEEARGDMFQITVLELLTEVAHAVARLEKLRSGYEEHDESVVCCEECGKLTARAGASFDEEDGVHLCPTCETPAPKTERDFDEIGRLFAEGFVAGETTADLAAYAAKFMSDRFGDKR